ncbi:MAG: hypothetical protein ACREU8_03175 [Gammaproteobacteria bacterium]
MKDAGVRVTYAQQIFREQLADCPVVKIEAALDGAHISGRYLLFEVLNMAYIGPNPFLAPDIVGNDGEFDVVLLAEKHRDRLHDHIKDWQEAARVRDAPGQAPDDRMGSPSISTTSCGRRRKRKRRSHPRR